MVNNLIRLFPILISAWKENTAIKSSGNKTNTTTAVDVDTFTLSDEGHNSNYSKKALEPVDVERKPIQFPIITGSSTEQIEKSIERSSKEALPALEKIKEKLSVENYNKTLSFIQKVFNEFNGAKINVVDRRHANTDPLFNLVSRLSQDRESILNENIDANLEDAFKFFKFQQEKGILFSYSFDNLLYESKILYRSKNGLDLLGSMLGGLKNGNIDLRNGNYLEALTNLTATIINQTKTKYPALGNKAFDIIAFDKLQKLQPVILKEILFLEKAKPGLGLMVTNLTHAYVKKNGTEGISEFFERVNQYVDGLVIQGETDLEDTLNSLNAIVGDIDLNKSTVEKLLKIHFYGGLARPSRLVHKDEKNKQEAFESVLENIVSSFEGKFNPDDKIALISTAGINQDTQSANAFDVLGFRFGGTLKQIVDENYKVLFFETDKDWQILKSATICKELTGKAPSIFMPAGHGSIGEDGKEDAKAIVLGKTRSRSLFNGINPEFTNDAKARNADLVKRLNNKYPLPKWNISGVGNSKVTYDAASLDKEDKDIFKRLAILFNKDTKVILDACSVGSGNNSIAQVLANELNLDVYASPNPIQESVLEFKNGMLVNVKFTHDLKDIQTERFTPQKK